MPAIFVPLVALSIIIGPFAGMNASDSSEQGLATGSIEGNSTGSEKPFVNATEFADISGVVLINEVELNPLGSDQAEEWVELYNPSEADASTDGLQINTSNSVTIDLDALGVIEAGETVVVPLGNSSLSNVGEALTLLNASNLEVVDSTPSLVDTMDSSRTWQRFPDGNEDWEFLEESKGTLNDPAGVQTNTSAIDTTEFAEGCVGSAGCVEGIAIRIVDGDTLYVSADDTIYKVDLALVSAVDRDDDSYLDTTMLTRSLCLGSPVLVDQDDGLLADDGSVIASVYCSSIGLNEELLDNGLASIDLDQCESSEFAVSDWALDHGC